MCLCSDSLIFFLVLTASAGQSVGSPASFNQPTPSTSFDPPSNGSALSSTYSDSSAQSNQLHHLHYQQSQQQQQQQQQPMDTQFASSLVNAGSPNYSLIGSRPSLLIGPSGSVIEDNEPGVKDASPEHSAFTYYASYGYEKLLGDDESNSGLNNSAGQATPAPVSANLSTTPLKFDPIAKSRLPPRGSSLNRTFIILANSRQKFTLCLRNH